jgi:hypothetical protein
VERNCENGARDTYTQERSWLLAVDDDRDARGHTAKAPAAIFAKGLKKSRRFRSESGGA